jgi:hypothetical protein
LIQDTSDMIDHLEARWPRPLMIPEAPVQRAVAWLLEAFGSEGLLPAGMSYRWTYRAQQEDFLRAEFGRIAYAGPDRRAQRAAGEQLMNYFNDFLPALGVTPETRPTVEIACLELLDVLDVHFQQHPYLMGGRPHSYPTDDGIPATLLPVLELVFRDWGVELLANAAFYDAWVGAHRDLPSGHLVSASGERKVHPTLGFLEYEWRGCRIRRASSPHGLWHFDKAASHARRLDGEALARFQALVRQTGGKQVMAIRLARPLRREHYALVLG